ncbi:recombinase RecT [Aminipila luticellarii]|uniref:Recombinase RecT n=2 Tax=Aminipila luticellarii TaxID=2507160 RepID=A0A410PYU3_9FIRM|nr:recombinase RecT [Aminipila luticellarii]
MGNEVAKKERNITDMVLGRVSQLTSRGELITPADYSPENALKSAWLILQEVKDRNQNLALNTCSKESICNALLDMVVQGLSPAKKQCYFVPYGNQLQLSRSYMGTVAVAKRFSDVKDVFANCIYEGDLFEYEIDVNTGNRKIVKHTQSFENIDITKIRGAYAVVIRENADNFVEIMTMEQIRKAWGQGATKGNSGAHKNFTEEMAKKTVINRACKMFVNTSDDSAILTEAYNRTTESDYSKEDRLIYDTDAEVIVDVEDAKKIEEMNENIFAGTPFEDEPIEAGEDEERGETDEANQG